MLPLSFSEYVAAYPPVGHVGGIPVDNKNLDDKFWDYVHNSGFPYVMRLTAAANPLLDGKDVWDVEQIRLFLKGLFDTIVLKDIVERKKIPDVSRLMDVIRFMFDNIGNETSIRNIKNMMELDGRRFDVSTIESYLNGLLDAFVLYKVGRFDIKGKQYLKTNAKYYLADVGMRYFLLGKEGDIGHVLENVVYLELLGRGYNVSIGKVGTNEVDFVAVKNGYTEYYQVAHELNNKATLDRELKALDAISDHNQKFLLTRDSFFQESHNGIKVLNALDWLVGK